MSLKTGDGLGKALVSDPYRYTCPRGHHTLTIRQADRPDSHGGRDRADHHSDGDLLCRTCRQKDNIDPYYDPSDVVDKKEEANRDPEDSTWPYP